MPPTHEKTKVDDLLILGRPMISKRNHVDGANVISIRNHVHEICRRFIRLMIHESNHVRLELAR
jgi:hypothetical protein